ncbi:MAG: hypothetical protein DRP01_03990 [Archaeoglobales archaeon]|nr:MAG: hypothetical protein DRP01_03990 [Archaeoglobales archaeon]
MISAKKMKFLNLIFNKLVHRPRTDRMFPIVDFTCNPVTGCLHYCKYCYARRLAETRLKNVPRYRKGFVPRINSREFRKRFCKNDIVFLCDMGDLFGDFIPREWIFKVLRYVKGFPKTYFLLLTKNPKRYHEFLEYFPDNVVLGATIETNRDDLYIKHNISKAPLPSERYKAMSSLDFGLKFVSIEPILEFDLEVLVKWIKEIDPVIVFVGYDNHNFKLPEPPYLDTLNLISMLEEFTIVIRKCIRWAWFEIPN